MSSGSHGYVSDIPYIPGYYRDQSPRHLSLACELAGYVGLRERGDEPLSYVELGCGLGMTSLLLAASNPHWQITAIDYSPASIAGARMIASDSGLANIRFLEADLATLAEDPESRQVPEADVLTMHGLWSWVTPPVRAGIVRLLRDKVRAGGVVYVSYNSLPAWQDSLGFQRLLYEAGRRLATRSDAQAIAGLEVAQALHASGAVRLQQAMGDGDFERLRRRPSYVAHEFLNAGWAPCFHSDVAAAIAEAKLDWVTTSSEVELLDALTMNDQQRAVLARFDDPVMRETIKDMCLRRALREDIFVRGARRLRASERHQRLLETTLALVCEPDKFAYRVELAGYGVDLDPTMFRPVMERLAMRPATAAALLDAAPVDAAAKNPTELIAMLVGSGQAIPVSTSGPKDETAARRLNRLLADYVLRPDTIMHGAALASATLGAALSMPMIAYIAWTRLHDGQAADPAAWAADFGRDMDENGREALREALQGTLEERLPTWRRLGIAPN